MSNREKQQQEEIVVPARVQDKQIVPPWGEIGYIVFKRTYSRKLNSKDKNSKTEEFYQVIERELDACKKQLKINFTEEEKKDYYNTRMQLKWSVAGRFMWQLGTKTVDKLGLPSLQNCAACVVNEPIRPFTWAFELLMLGSGVGYNIQRHNVYQLPKLKGGVKIERKDTNDVDFIVPDNREGWVKLLAKVLKAHFYSGEGFTYGVHCVRGKDAPIEGFGGVASGPEELCKGIEQIHDILNERAGKKLRPIHCLDIMNLIGSIVVSGNVRRSAQIAIGDCDDIEFLKAKRWDLSSIPNHRAMSNNSVVCDNTKRLPKEFWETYQQGEPYGLINLDLAKSCGRLGETQYPDAGVEITNPCQPDFATILTPEGVKTLKDLSIGDSIWSKEGWTKVVNKWSTGVKRVYNHYTTGGVFTGTMNHRVDTKEGKVEVRNAESILTISREKPDKVDLDYQIVLDGLFLGDGFHKIMNNRGYTYPLLIVGENDQDYFNSEIKDFIENKFESKKTCSSYKVNTTITKDESKKREFCEIPERYYLKSNKITFSILRGLYTANGCVNSNVISYKSVSKKLIRQIQLLLSSIGIRSYITTNKSTKVKFSNGEYICKESYDLNISKDILIFKELIGFIQEYKVSKLDKIVKKPNISETYTKKSQIDYLGEYEVFDITVDNSSHTYWTGGLSVSNCAEQFLEDKETCCLAEVYLPNISTYQEFIKCITLAYKVCKHSLRLHCSLKDTESIVHKNMRMGIGITGVLQSSKSQRSWLNQAYTKLRKIDKEYSKLQEWPESIKLTTVKPSGTLSLLAGVTPGVHPNPAGPYYIRRVRIASNSHLIDVCRTSGYGIEPAINFDGTEDKNTMVVSFPCKVSEETPIASNYSWKEQLEMVKWMQENWSDNSVSCTVYYKKEDLEDIKKYLEENYSNNFKTLSFLLYQGHGFTQAPYETISKSKYEELVKDTVPITSIEIQEKDFEVDDCSSGQCPIK